MTSAISRTSASVATKQRRKQTIERQRIWGWIFLSPWIVGFLVFTAFPMLSSLVLSFTDFRFGQEIHWVGLRNWELLIRDPQTLHSFGVTLRFGLILLPVSLSVPLFLATLLNSKALVGKRFFRLCFYMPYVVPSISSTLMWQSFLSGQTGWLNRLLRAIGIANPPNWLTNSHYIHTALVMIMLWGAGNAMLTILVSLERVPTELYEAATVDGAGSFTMWRHITLPLISPVIFYNLILSVIALMQYFQVPFVLYHNNISDPTLYFINLHLYLTAFRYNNPGYASALAWSMFVVGIVIIIGLFATSRRWVYYAGEN
jgi:ABC-type sugar transport system permease subunit